MQLRIIRAGALYYALGFGAGFALGVVRTLWIAPRIGAGAAEIAETPLVLACSYLAARFVVRRCALPDAAGPRLGAGAFALLLLVATELTVVLALRGSSLREYVEQREPLAFGVYLAALVAFALMPFFVRRGARVARA